MNASKHWEILALLRRIDRDDGFVGPDFGTHAHGAFTATRAGMTTGMPTRVSACGRCAFGATVPIGERRRRNPSIERVFVTPASDHEPLVTTISGLEEFKALKAVGSIDRTSAGSKSVGKLVAGLGRNGDGIDANN